MAILATFLQISETSSKPCSRNGPQRHRFIGPHIPIDIDIRDSEVENLKEYLKKANAIEKQGMKPYLICQNCHSEDQIASWQGTEKCFKKDWGHENKTKSGSDDILSEPLGFYRCVGKVGFNYPCPKGLVWRHEEFICSKSWLS